MNRLERFAMWVCIILLSLSTAIGHINHVKLNPNATIVVPICDSCKFRNSLQNRLGPGRKDA